MLILNFYNEKRNSKLTFSINYWRNYYWFTSRQLLFMTPKEKAKQIVDELQFAIIERNGILYSGIKKDVAIEASKIVITNILREEISLTYTIYWDNVIKEIEKL